MSTLADLVEDALNELGAEGTVNLDRGTVRLTTGSSFALETLARELADISPERWSERVRDFVEQSLSSAVPDQAATFEQTAPQLRIRVGEPNALGVDVDRLVAEASIGDLVMAAVVVNGDESTYVTLDEAEGWGRSESDIITIAVYQSLAESTTPITEDVDGTAHTRVEHIGASARILDPRTVVAAIPPAGLIIAIPSVDEFHAVAVDEQLDGYELTALAGQTVTDYAAAAKPSSKNLFWWHDGTADPLNYADGLLDLPVALRRALG
jgi:hypothetical protein